MTFDVKPEEWPHPYKEYPSAARLGLNATPADYALSGTRVWFVAPEIFYPDACLKAFGNRLRIPCPYCKSADHVGASGWTDVPRRVNDLGRCDWALARRYKCSKCAEQKGECPLVHALAGPHAPRTSLHSCTWRELLKFPLWLALHYLRCAWQAHSSTANLLQHLACVFTTTQPIG